MKSLHVTLLKKKKKSSTSISELTPAAGCSISHQPLYSIEPKANNTSPGLITRPGVESTYRPHLVWTVHIRIRQIHDVHDVQNTKRGWRLSSRRQLTPGRPWLPKGPLHVGEGLQRRPNGTMLIWTRYRAWKTNHQRVTSWEEKGLHNTSRAYDVTDKLTIVFTSSCFIRLLFKMWCEKTEISVCLF